MTAAFRRSTVKDIPQLVQLVNSAYRGENAKKGWTHEADLIKGSIRITDAALKEMMNTSQATVLQCAKDNRLVGCVYLEQQESEMYLGMLTVDPNLQGSGIGKQLLQAAESWAKQNNCVATFMNVISERTELIAWYTKHGYQLTDRRKPFPDDERFGKPVKPLEFIILRKEI